MTPPRTNIFPCDPSRDVTTEAGARPGDGWTYTNTRICDFMNGIRKPPGLDDQPAPDRFDQSKATPSPVGNGPPS